MVVVLTGCTTILEPAPSSPSPGATTVAATTTPGPSGVTSSATTTPKTESAGVTTPTPADTSAPAVTSFEPSTDADAVSGKCPYLTQDQVQSATGDRVGGQRVRPAEPQPVCEFTGTGGDFLATVRVLRLPDEALAVSAVDFYVPRDGSNPESRPAGWTGGSIPTDAGYMVAVSKGDWAVIAEANQPQSVSARQLVIAAITALGI